MSLHAWLPLRAQSFQSISHQRMVLNSLVTYFVLIQRLKRNSFTDAGSPIFLTPYYKGIGVVSLPMVRQEQEKHTQ
jgi:hypothetical protein